MAVKLTVIGSFGAVVLSILMFPLSIPIVKHLYPYIEPYIGIILIIVVVCMILRDRKKLWALFVFLIAGALGLTVFGITELSQPLFPLLSGMYGISTLLISLNDDNNIPKQKIRQDIQLDWGCAIKALLSGQFSGFLTAVFPGLGGSTAAVIGMQLARDIGDHGFMVLMGSINTVNFVMSISTLYVLGKARNGSIIAVSKLVENINLHYVIVFLASALIAGCAGVFLAIYIGKLFSRFITKISYKKVVISIILLIIVMTFVLSGWIGFIVLIVSTAVGIIPAITKVTRTHAMGCLLLPVILYFVL